MPLDQQLPQQSIFNSALGAWVEERRKELHLSRNKLGTAVGVHRNTVMRWESGECAMTVWQFTRVCVALDKQMTVASMDVQPELLRKIA